MKDELQMYQENPHFDIYEQGETTSTTMVEALSLGRKNGFTMLRARAEHHYRAGPDACASKCASPLLITLHPASSTRTRPRVSRHARPLRVYVRASSQRLHVQARGGRLGARLRAWLHRARGAAPGSRRELRRRPPRRCLRRRSRLLGRRRRREPATPAARRARPPRRRPPRDRPPRRRLPRRWRPRRRRRPPDRLLAAAAVGRSRLLDGGVTARCRTDEHKLNDYVRGRAGLISGIAGIAGIEPP